MRHIWKTAIIACCLVAPLWAQDETPPTEPVSEETPAAEAEGTAVISGGVTYAPNIDPNEEAMRDPFKSPFDLEQERKEAAARQSDITTDDAMRQEFMVQELNLKGIYLEARTGYWAIFEVGGEYKWFQSGERFQDGDLVNITDNEVLFKQYIEDESQDLAHREIVLELRRGEE